MPDVPEPVGARYWDRALARMGYDGLSYGMARKGPAHPDHCGVCAEARVDTERELRETQDALDLLLGALVRDRRPPHP